jgi:hypothetical protein
MSLRVPEAEKAEAFGKLDTWILATTWKRDGIIQKQARLLDGLYRRRRIVEVQLWFWQDYETWLYVYAELRERYYDRIMNLRSPHDQDRLILDLLATAFHQ